jgi:hypothetical protein
MRPELNGAASEYLLQRQAEGVHYVCRLIHELPKDLSPMWLKATSHRCRAVGCLRWRHRLRDIQLESQHQ